jgi:ribosomal protein S18 acetylase RimI-like enzyme
MIRRAVGADAEALIPLIEAHAEFEQAPLTRLPDAMRLAIDLADPASGWCAWIAQTDGEIVGYVSGSVGYSTRHARRQFNLDCLYLSPRARGLGVGRLTKR